jgi:hypothetical protein
MAQRKDFPKVLPRDKLAKGIQAEYQIERISGGQSPPEITEGIDGV